MIEDNKGLLYLCHTGWSEQYHAKTSCCSRQLPEVKVIQSNEKIKIKNKSQDYLVLVRERTALVTGDKQTVHMVLGGNEVLYNVNTQCDCLC